MISDDEAKFYHENGYLVVEDVYSQDEISAMRSVLGELIDKARGLDDHDNVYDLEPSHTPDNPRVRRIKEPYKVHPIFREMAQTPNIVSILTKLIGPDQRLHGGKINIKAAEYGSPVEWHQDWAFYPHTNDDVLAIGVMLDDMTEENGPLLIMPGVWPLIFNSFASHIAIGVFPVPPAVIFPIIITGTFTLFDNKKLQRYKNSLNLIITRYIQLNGINMSPEIAFSYHTL